ncbi:MAG: hypothetical protein U0821_04095 [Chloroflexota bacterium]
MAHELAGSAGVTVPSTPDSLAIFRVEVAGRSTTAVFANDACGLAYGVLELADRLECGADIEQALRVERPIVESPANTIRAVSRLFVSDVEDLPWFRDRQFWQAYLDLLIAQRFNRFHLAFGIGHDFLRDVRDAYLLFPYPFLVNPPGYAVRAGDLPDAERQANLEMLRFISDEAHARGLHFQLGIWTQAYEWTESPRASHVITGLDNSNHAAYCRDSLAAVLRECPSIDGVTMRVHGESGVPEGSYDFWQTVFEAISGAGRPVELDLHPKGVDRRMIDLALATGQRVAISPKYSAEHMGLPGHQSEIRPSELDFDPSDHDAFMQSLMGQSAGSMRYTRYGHADFLREDRRYGVYYRIWPGTQRLLAWGDPVFAAGYGRNGSFAGCLGVDWCEPLSFKGRRGSGLPGGRTAYADASLSPRYDFEKYEYAYRLLGRMLYCPDTPAEVWRRYLSREFGEAAPDVESAMAQAGRILPLITSAHHPSAANNRYWPELYANMPIVDPDRVHHYRDTPSPRRFGTVSPYDPGLFSRIDEFADEVVTGPRSGRYSPLRVALWLEALADGAAAAIVGATVAVADPEAVGFRRLKVDTEIQVALGRFFAHKLRAGVAWELYRREGDGRRGQEALEEYGRARDAWLAAIEAGAVYREDITVGGEPWLRGHWRDRLPALDGDIADMRAALVTDSAASVRRFRALAELDTAELRMTCQHTPPDGFRPGQPVTVALSVGDAAGVRARLHYRHVDQSKRHSIVDMTGSAEHLSATIPGTATDSPYPLQYFFELFGPDGSAALYPGLEGDLSALAYFVMRQR